MRPDPAPFMTHRPRLVRLAYRMLGSIAEAEDMAQEAWLRWQLTDHRAVADPAAYLSRTVTRLCLDQMKSARARHEEYVGPWLPEPIVEPEEGMRLDELTLTLMMALERLSPLERAAFLLHDVFDQPLAEIAVTLDRDPAAVRQLAARARKHVRASGPRYPVQREEGARIARAFFDASASGDISALRSLLSANVTIQADGGGKVTAFRNVIAGQDRVLRLYEGLARKYAANPPLFIDAVWIDGLPGYVSHDRDNVLQTTAFAIENGVVAAIYITRNPDKLGSVRDVLPRLGQQDARL